MKKFLRTFLTLMLVTLMGLFSTFSSFAMSSRSGGTWTVNNWVSSESLSLESLPCKIVYLPYSKVAKLHNADLANNNLSKYLKEYGSQALTTSIAKKIGARLGADLTPLVGYGFICYDLANMLYEDQMANKINNAYNSREGLVCTLYNAQGTLYWRFKNWNSYSMPTRINFTTISGYATGDISVGTYDFSEDY